MKKVDQLMQERQSARNFNPDFQIPQADLEIILNAIRLSPTSYNLLNYRLLVWPKSPSRDELNEVFFSQKNFTNSSVYLLFVVKNGQTIKDKTIYEIADLIFAQPEMEGHKKQFIQNFLSSMDFHFQSNPVLADEWSAKIAYIGAGIATVAAASVGIDSCLQEGFDSQKLNQFLRAKELITNDEQAVLGMALGQAVGKNPNKPKIRQTYEDFVKVVK